MTTDLQEQAAAPDENKIIAERRAKLAAIREQGVAFPNDFKPEHKAADLRAIRREDARRAGSQPVTVVLAGRMMLKREAGKKAAFATLQDSSGPRPTAASRSTPRWT
jgi:lysyl-tRNA synthetase class 2